MSKVNIADYIGKKYSKLIILSEAPSQDKWNNTRFFTKCDCGNFKNVSLKSLRSGTTRSCGCLNKIYHENRIQHGLTKHPIYLIWYNIIDRCTNPESKDYHNYGGRGIKVCDEWKNDVTAFYNWAISHGWKKGLKTDRINNNGNYEPSNIRFVIPFINSLNRRDTIMVSYKGKTIAAGLILKENNIDRTVFTGRIKRGWDVERALTEKPRKKRKSISIRS